MYSLSLGSIVGACLPFLLLQEAQFSCTGVWLGPRRQAHEVTSYCPSKVHMSLLVLLKASSNGDEVFCLHVANGPQLEPSRPPTWATSADGCGCHHWGCQNVPQCPGQDPPSGEHHRAEVRAVTEEVRSFLFKNIQCVCMIITCRRGLNPGGMLRGDHLCTPGETCVT